MTLKKYFLAAVAFGAMSGASAAQAGAIPSLDHIFNIILENHNLTSVSGDPTPGYIGNTADAPFINSLANTYNSASNYSAIGHPSLPNYLEMTGGSNFGVTSDNVPNWGSTVTTSTTVGQISGTGIDAGTPPVLNGVPTGVNYAPTTYTGQTIADQLTAAGKTWRSYQENLPSTGAYGVNNADNNNVPNTDPAYNGNRFYAVKHDPFAYFASVQNDPTQLANIVGFDQLTADLGAGFAPNYSLIVPNQCNDAHGVSGCTSNPDALIQGSDAAVKALVTEIMNSPVWSQGMNAIVIVADENDFSTSGNLVPFIVVDNYGAAGTSSNVAYNHYDLLKTEETALGVGCLNHACDTGAQVMSDLFSPVPEPGELALFGLGLVGVRALRRRRA